ARNHEGFNKLHPFFQVIQQDPVLSQVKLIAEPWDVARAGIKSGIFRRPGRNGTANIATRFAVFGRAMRAALGRWDTGSPGAPIVINTLGGARMRALISSLRTMVSHCGTS